jgi:DNA-binding transcriptional ArsR family regulator
MLEYLVDTDQLAHTRFGCSVLHEVVAAMRVLGDPGAHAMHLPWVRATLPAVPALGLRLLPALVPPAGYIPDFLTPPPDSPFPALPTELARLRASPGEQVATELGWLFSDGVPPVLHELLQEPAAGLARLADEMTRLFVAALAPHWPGLRALLQADVAYRARQVAEVGARAMLEDLHPGIRWTSGGRLVLPVGYDAPVTVEGPGLVLMPSVFTWPRLHAIVDAPWQTTLIYPARGVATAWEPTPPPGNDALSRVIGRSRADLLLALDVPRTGSQLAAVLGLSAAAISEHISALRDAGLVSTHRDGRHVIACRTTLGNHLLSGGAPDSVL